MRTPEFGESNFELRVYELRNGVNGGEKGELMGDCREKDEKSEGFDGKKRNLVEEKVRLVGEWGGHK